MELIAGIDLGTTNSLIGVMDAGFPVLLADENGQRLTPSVVHYPVDRESAPIVGTEALRMAAVHPARTVSRIKRFIGRRTQEIQPDELTGLGYHLAPSPTGGNVVVQLDKDTQVTPIEVSAEILRRLQAIALARMEGTPVERAVITVPAYFNDAQRKATREAGERAGWQVERIISEPTAAALAYGADKLGERTRVAVFDFGGGTFDLSILELREGVFDVLSTHGDTRLGGEDINRAVEAWVMEQMRDQFPALEMDALLAGRLRAEVERVKLILSSQDQAELSLPFIDRAGNFTATLLRTKFEELARPVIERMRRPCLQSIADSGLRIEDLDQVILVGGSTRMPAVRRFAEEIFGQAANTSQHPDEAVALGATLQAGVLSGAVSDMLLLDITPLSLGIETFGGLMNVIIPRNTTIPCKQGELFTNAVAGQEAMAVRILQGEREMARDNWELGQVEIPFQPAPKGQARVGVQFQIDADGVLEVLVRDTQTGQEQTLNIQSAVDVSDEAVEAMIAESVDFAFEDMNERIWTETRLKSEELLPAVDNALKIAGGDLPADERRQIENLAAQMRRHLETNDPARAQPLRQLNRELDDATQNLATLVIEKMMGDQSD